MWQVGGALRAVIAISATTNGKEIWSGRKSPQTMCENTRELGTYNFNKVMYTHTRWPRCQYTIYNAQCTICMYAEGQLIRQNTPSIFNIYLTFQSAESQHSPRDSYAEFN